MEKRERQAIEQHEYYDIFCDKMEWFVYTRKYSEHMADNCNFWM